MPQSPHCRSYLLWASIEFNHSAQRTAAYPTKFGYLICAHAAIHIRAVHPFRHVATTFIYADAAHVHLRESFGRGGNFRTAGEHILPFAAEIGQCGDVLFPRLHISRIEIAVLVVIKVLIGQSPEGMSEFVHRDRKEQAVVGSRKHITL